MATSGSGTSIPAVSAVGNYTLAQLVSKWRVRLDDTLEPYLWSNEELTEYADVLQKMIFDEMLHYEDRSTEGVCNVNLVQGNGLINISTRITKVIRAKLDSQTRWLDMRDLAYMDERYPGWDITPATQEIPHTFVTGMPYGKAYLYPPHSSLTDVLRLVVHRRPLVDLDWGTHSGSPLEVDRFAELLVHGIMWQAYLKQDADTYDPKRAEEQRLMWEGENHRGGDKDQIRRIIIRETSPARSASPMAAFQ